MFLLCRSIWKRLVILSMRLLTKQLTYLKLVDFLIGCGKQVIVTTHSPMILNYIPDEVAKEGVIMLYRTSKGETRSARFFDLPAMQQKLRALGPGEVFADTRLTELTAELEQQGNGISSSLSRP